MELNPFYKRNFFDAQSIVEWGEFQFIFSHTEEN